MITQTLFYIFCALVLAVIGVTYVAGYNKMKNKQFKRN